MDASKKKHESMDEYINSFPEDVKAVLKEVRNVIKNEAPEAEEAISYSMPTFKLNGKYLVYFAGWKDHIALYPATGSMDVDKEMQQYRTGKGTFQFSLKEELPWNIIRKIVKVRVKEVKSKVD